MKTQIEIEITPDQLAESFVNWRSDEQAKFFNLIGSHFKKAPFNAESQCCYLVDDINNDGKDFIFTVANFLKARGIPCGSPKENILLNFYKGGIL